MNDFSRVYTDPRVALALQINMLKSRQHGSSDGLYIDLNGGAAPRRIDDEVINETMKRSVIRDNFEQLSELPSHRVSKWEKKRKRTEARAQTKGPGWFDLRAPEMDEPMVNSLRVLAMRHALDSKRFYKRYERNTLPKFAQVCHFLPYSLSNFRVTGNLVLMRCILCDSLVLWWNPKQISTQVVFLNVSDVPISLRSFFLTLTFGGTPNEGTLKLRRNVLPWRRGNDDWLKERKLSRTRVKARKAPAKLSVRGRTRSKPSRLVRFRFH